MESFNVPPLEPGCPWSTWALPNIKWCESNLCSWITAPANTWTNLMYIILGLFMWHYAKKHRLVSVKLFGPCAILTGLFSFIYHASYTAFFQFFDYLGMFIFIFVIITFNLRRMKKLSVNNQLPVFLVGIGFCSALVPLFNYLSIPIQLIVVSLAVISISLEAALFFIQKNTQYKFFLVSMGCLALAVTFFALDLTRTWCNPDNHWLQGHGLWHSFTSLAFFALFFFYSQFDKES